MFLNEFDSELYQEKYRIKSTRHPDWDYSSDGYYFVTICTKGCEEFFGEIKNGIMGLNEIGCMVSEFWKEIPKHFPFVILDEWTVMPNHVHGIIIIDNPNQCRDAINRVSTEDYINGGITGRNNPMGKKCLGEIVRWLKGRTSFEIHKIDKHFSWQSRFYDHIIRDEKSLEYIREYIYYNPYKWDLDRNNPVGLWM